MTKYTNTAKKTTKKTTKTTKSMSKDLIDAFEALDNLKAKAKAAGVHVTEDFTLCDLDDALNAIKLPKKPKKLSAREQAVHDMDVDNDKINSIPDSMLYILKYTATCFKFGFALPGSDLVYSSADNQRLDDFQFCVSALEHAANLKLITNISYIHIPDYVDTSCSDKFNTAMMKAILEPCKARVLELLSRINTAKLNVGTEQDIIDFKTRVGILN